jgi:hypothetical protein
MEMEQLLQRISNTFYYSDGKLLYKGGFRQPVDKESGWVSWNGYRMVSFEGKHYKAHRIIFALHYGYFPKLVDHIDQNKLNNRIENLREASRSVNAFNSKKRATNSSGMTGVGFRKDRNKWRAFMTLDNVRHHIGTFETQEEALIARLDFERNKRKEIQ